jgi:hypothetical protein
MKVHYIGKTYKIQEIIYGNQLMYVIVRNDGRAVFTAYAVLEEAKTAWKTMEGIV